MDTLRSLRPDIVVKLNTVVSTDNCDADLSELVSRIQPQRWKVLQVLPIYPTDALEDAEFQEFVDRHQQFSAIMAVGGQTTE